MRSVAFWWVCALVCVWCLVGFTSRSLAGGGKAASLDKQVLAGRQAAKRGTQDL
nr:hypothetical protein [Kibdelosporangium sp. MJ126-NF4]